MSLALICQGQICPWLNFQNEKCSEVYRRNNNWPITMPCGTPDTLSTSLLQQPSTITCCDWFDRSCISIDNTEPPNTHRAEPLENALMVDPINGSTEINLLDPTLLPTLQCTLQCMGNAQKCITGTQTFPISKLGGWKHTAAFHKSSKMNRHQRLRHLR